MATPIPTPTPTLEPCPGDSPTGDATINATDALLICVSMLFVILLTSYYLQSKKIRYLHETVVSIFLGLIIGMVVHFNPKGTLNDLVTFDHTYFFNLLLPPIILNSGYDMKRKHFFRNIGSILTFALIGTVISTIVIGVLVKLAVNFLEITHIHTALNLTMLDCIVFGAILSSTDPVTILSIFHQAKVDPKLYAIIFGESILNDSVAIVLFKVLGKYRASPESFNIIGGIMSFLAIFTGSVMVGVIVALIGALMLKHSRLHEYPSLESSIIILLAYSSYLLSNAVQLSGIVSLLFCGICLRHYGYNNMSIRTRRTTKYMFRVLSQLCENFVFIYLGVTVFTSLKSSLKDEGYRPGLIFFTLFICLFARYVSVIPLAKMINAISARLSGTPGREEIPRNHQLMLWWAGLRGAIAFALSFEVKAEGSENTDKIIQTTTLIICIVTVILLGGTTNMALEKLEIRVGVGKSEGNDGNDFDDDEEDPDTDSSEGESEDWDDDLPGSRSSLYDGTAEDQRSSAESLLERNRSIRVEVDDESRPSRSAWDEDLGHWFISFDNKWLKPLFTRTRWKWGRSRVRRPQSPARGAWNGDSVGRTMGNNNIRGRSTRTFGNTAAGFGRQAPAASSSANRSPDNESFRDVNGNVWTAGNWVPNNARASQYANNVELEEPADYNRALRASRSNSKLNSFTME